MVITLMSRMWSNLQQVFAQLIVHVLFLIEIWSLLNWEYSACHRARAWLNNDVCWFNSSYTMLLVLEELTFRNVRMPGTWSSMIKSNILIFLWSFLICNNPRTCSFKTPTRRWAAQWKSLALARKCEHVVLKWHHRLSFSQGKSGDNTGRGNASLCFFHPCSNTSSCTADCRPGICWCYYPILHLWTFTRLYEPVYVKAGKGG